MAGALAWRHPPSELRVSTSGHDSLSRPAPKVWIAGLGALLVLVAAGTWALKVNRSEVVPVAAGAGLQVSIAVEPFEVGDSVPAEWNAATFSDSLAAQLSLIQGISAASRGLRARYVLRGNVSMKEGRMILATRLGRDGERDTVWTATFWRSATSGSSVLTDLAQAVAEAAFSQSARESFNQKRKAP